VYTSDRYVQMKKATSAEEEEGMKKRCLDLLERYIYLVLFNAYLHCDRHNKWQRSFSAWMSEVREPLHRGTSSLRVACRTASYVRPSFTTHQQTGPTASVITSPVALTVPIMKAWKLC